ncbi:hypothetical protein HDU79_009439 [Rhizoclosmatium sp. JEL0117]|nr:hypothetical protein HDU79_009439 [Rhizoclosmatium sp. JEL0117]
MFYVDDVVERAATPDQHQRLLGLVIATALEDEDEDSDDDANENNNKEPPPPTGFVRVAWLNGSKHETINEQTIKLVDRAASIGEITHLTDKIALLIPSTQAIVIPKDTDRILPMDGIDDSSKFALARFYPGQAVASETKSNLKNGVWLKGEWNDSFRLDEVLIVVGVKAVKAQVLWRVYNTLQNTTGASQVDPPPEEIDPSLLTPLTSIFEPLSFQCGDFVTFRDEALAKQVLNLAPHFEMDTSPFMFALRIAETKTTVTVQWQDGTSTASLPSTELTPLLHPDDHDFWPTDYITLAPTTTFPLSQPSTTQPHPTQDTIGLILHCNARARTVQVRWYTQDLTTLHPSPPLSYSSYEVQMHPDLQHRPGDRVILTRAQSDASTDWFGEVLRVDLETGLVDVRFFGSGCVGVCSPGVLLVYKVVGEEEDGGEEGMEEDEWEDQVWDADSERGGGSSVSGVSWETDDDDVAGGGGGGGGEDPFEVDDEEMADSVDALNKTHIGTPPDGMQVFSGGDRRPPLKLVKSVSMLTEDEIEWNTFKSLERAPEGHRFYASGSLSYPHAFHQRIRKEYSILSKTLPQGILVRVFEDRIDLLRVLMIGPDATPYEGGLFLFDVSLPVDYPNSPPNVFFHSWTFGMGRMNPNLYEDGKVCLSLLGTWTTSHPSESWSPTKSNLLQLVVSLQSLVLTRQPYFNEPGYEKQIDTEEGRLASQLYNERVYLLVLRSMEFVMKELLDGFEGEIGYHFYRVGWLRKVLERGNEIVSRSLLLAGKDEDEVDEGVGGEVVGFPIRSVSVGCLKLLRVRLDALAAFADGRVN